LDHNEWLVFFIGSENEDPDLTGLSLAVAKFHNSGNWLGCVGVLGPKRMPYLRAMQMMRYAGEAIANRTI
jgi:transcriptional regulator of heat shock response